MYDRKAFKNEAKQLMRASTPHFMLVSLVYVLLTTGLSYAVTWLTDGMLGGVIGMFLNVLISLFSLVMGVGLSNYALRLARKEQNGLGDLFESFSYAGRSIGTNILVAVYTFLWCLLGVAVFAAILSGVMVAGAGVLVNVLVAVVLYIALLVFIIWVALRYALANFALADNPAGGASEAVRRSVRILKGHKGKLFVLELSFLGWNLLVALIGMVVLGIGIFVTGTAWMFENLLLVGEDWMEVYSVVGDLLGQLTLWTTLAEVLCLPLTLWLTVYMQTAYARFYNYVGGYDYHQYMHARENPVEQPVFAPPAGQEEPKQENAAAQDVPPAQDNYYTSVLPPEESGEDEEI